MAYPAIFVTSICTSVCHTWFNKTLCVGCLLFFFAHQHVECFITKNGIDEEVIELQRYDVWNSIRMYMTNGNYAVECKRLLN